VAHGISSGYVELTTVEVATGTWRHRFNFDPRHGGGADCCEAIAWPAGWRRLAVVRAEHGGGTAVAHRLVYVDPATGAASPGPLLAGRGVTFLPTLEVDPSGRYLLYGVQDTHSVSTWWWSPGGRPVRVKWVEIGSHVPAEAAGAYVGGAW
jgi:hypothetical protein